MKERIYYKLSIEKIDDNTNNILNMRSEMSGDLNWVLLKFLTESLPKFLKEINFEVKK